MKKYDIVYHGWHSLKEETGNDFVYFDCMVHYGENPTNCFPVNLPYHIIEQQIEKAIPSGSSILQQIKKRTKGWGPQESAYVREMAECGIDLERIVIKAIENSIDLDEESQRWIKMQNSSIQAGNILDDLEDKLVALRQESINYEQICNRLEKVITDEMISLFPQLLNSSSGCILRLQNILIKHIPDFAEDLSELVSEADDED